jgi:hypothetical protein
MVPASWHPRIVNAGDFFGILLFDLWTNRLDNRQALFVHIPGNQLRVIFINHGRMFGPTDSLRKRVGRVRFLDTRVYSLGSAALLTRWQKRIEAVSTSRISYVMDTVPLSWRRPGYPEVILNRLLEAQARISADVRSLRALLEEDDSLLVTSPRDIHGRAGQGLDSNRNRLRIGYAISPA